MKPLSFPHEMRVLVLALSAFAAVPASADAAASDVRAVASAPSAAATAHAAVDAYLALWAAEVRDDAASPFSDDLVLRYSHSTPELRAEARGRTSAVNQIRAVARLGSDWRFRDVRLYPTLHDNVYFATYTASGTAADGTAVKQNVVIAVELDGHKAVRLVEFANPAIVLASGTPGRMAASR